MMIYVGLDDTDTLDSPGTNQLAKSIVADLADRFECVLILRHQLLYDPRVPFTSKNGSASILLKPIADDLKAAPEEAVCDVVFEVFRTGLQERFIPGSDPGMCIASNVPRAIIAFGLRCQRELISQTLPRQLARDHNIRLEGLGGTEDGVIGALAAIGLAAGRNDGRVVKLGTWPDDLSGPHPVETLTAREVLVRDVDNEEPVRKGSVDVGKHLRPNYRNGEVVLYVESRGGPMSNKTEHWQAVRLP
jgi:hypothetical protein